MQWCVLAPLCPDATGPKKPLRGSLNKLGNNDSEFANGVNVLSLEVSTKEKEQTKDVDTQTLVASLHADLLSGILSLSKPLPCQLSGDEVAVLVANLLKYYTQRKMTDGRELVEEMDECVERLAQLLQISLSSGLLMLGSGM